MKRNLLISILSFLPFLALGQSKFAGDWQGKVDAGNGKAITIVFHFKDNGNGGLSGIMDSPDQGVTDIACQGVTLNGDSLNVDMTNLGISYEGILIGRDSITGTWHQANMGIALNFKKTTRPVEMKRPQTPKPPFPYKSEDVIYYNQDKSIQYGATITTPKGKGPFPAVLLITGSGQQNRDEELFGHKPFAVIADYLTRRGYVVMRVDDRGVGKSTGDAINATTADFAKDVNVSLDYLKQQKEVNKKKVGMLGHSEGGIIAPMVASERKDIDFIILMAGPGEKIPKMMEDQSAAILEGTTADQDVIKQYKQLYSSMLAAVMNASTQKDAQNRISLALDAWIKKTPQVTIEKLGLDKEDAQAEYVKSFAQMYGNKWFNYFLHIDPAVYLEKLSCKVLAINGDKDVQVIAKPNLAAIKAALAKSKSKDYEVKDLPGLNHLFQQCKTCTANEYGALEQTMSPVALKTIGDWLDKNVKR